MKRLIATFLLLAIIFIGTASSAENNSTESPQYYPQNIQPCGYCGGAGTIIVGYNAWGYPVYQTCSACGGRGHTTPNIPFPSNWIKVKKAAECDPNGGALCSCNYYIGYRYKGTDRYQGACENIINGHRCGHSPSEHGLKEY